MTVERDKDIEQQAQLMKELINKYLANFRNEYHEEGTEEDLDNYEDYLNHFTDVMCWWNKTPLTFEQWLHPESLESK